MPAHLWIEFVVLGGFVLSLGAAAYVARRGR